MEEKKKCPYCGEEILAVAKKCKHCGEWLDKDEKAGTPVDSRYPIASGTGQKKWKVVGILALLVILVGGYFINSSHQDKPKDEILAEQSDPVINFAEPEEEEEGTALENKEGDRPMQTEQAPEDILSPDGDKTSADSYSAEELLTLGESYEKGMGVEEDHEVAFNYYEKAAKTGHPAALNKLGNMYAQGKGCTKNASKAASCYLAAAEKGNKYAQHNIAFCYWDGVGVEQDREKGIMWMRRSAAQGYEKAKKALKTMGVE